MQRFRRSASSVFGVTRNGCAHALFAALQFINLADALWLRPAKRGGIPVTTEQIQPLAQERLAFSFSSTVFLVLASLLAFIASAMRF